MKSNIQDAVILVGGLGKRLRPLTRITPKPLLPMGNTTVLEILIKQLKKSGIKRVFLATGYLHEKFLSKLNKKKLGVELIYSRETKSLGTCGPLTLLEKKIKKPIVLINGDIITNLDFKELFKSFFKKKKVLTVATTKINIPFEFGKIISKNGLIKSIKEKPLIVEEILAGIYVLSPKCITLIPKNKYYGIDSLIKKLLKRNIKISKFLIKDYWIDIGSKPDYIKTKNKFDKKK